MVAAANAAAAKRVSLERRTVPDDEAAHRKPRISRCFGHIGMHLALKPRGEGGDARVVADGLDAVAGKDAGVAVGDIDAIVAAPDGHHHHAVGVAHAEFGERASAPARVGRDFELRDMYVAGFEPAGVGWHSRHGGAARADLADLKVLHERALHLDAHPLHAARCHHGSHYEQRGSHVERPPERREEI